MNQLKKLSLSFSINNGKYNRILWKQVLSPLFIYWSNLFDKTKQLKKVVPKGSSSSSSSKAINPLHSFILLEIKKCNQLIYLVHNSFKNLNLLINGLKILTPNLLTIGYNLINNQIPWLWQQHWYGPDQNIKKWLSELIIRKIKLIENWYDQDFFQNPKKKIALNELLRPKVFLNAFKQYIAQQSHIAIDSLKLAISWHLDKLPKDSIKLNISSLYIQGAGFNENFQLYPLSAKDSSILTIPNCYLTFILKTDHDPYHLDSLAIPLYNSISREEYITDILIPCTKNHSSWILSGIALFLIIYQ